MSAKSWIP